MELPDRRKHTYDKLEHHLDERLDGIENRVAKWIRRGLIAFGIVGLFCTAALVGMTIAIHEIQQQRYDFCVAQNERHDDTLAQMKKAQDETIAKHPEFAEITREGKAANERIINAIAPKLNCSKIKVLDLTPW
jgi:hypothetical protein